MIGSIFIILLIFSAVWFLIWLWFFKSDSEPKVNFYKLGDKAFESGDYKNAKELFLQIANIASNVEANRKLGISYLKLGEYDNAKACFEQIVKKSPKNIEAQISLAQILELQNKYDEALSIYNNIATISPKDPSGPVNIARIYSEKGDFAKAMETLEKAKKTLPDNSQILFSIIKCKSKLCNMENDNECQQIINEYAKIANRNDLPLEFNSAFAKAYAMKGDIEKALECSKKAIALNAEDVEAYQLLGLINLVKQDFDVAKSNLTVALNFQPNNKETHNIFSYVLCQSVTSCTLSKCRENYYNLIKKHLK